MTPECLAEVAASDLGNLWTSVVYSVVVVVEPLSIDDDVSVRPGVLVFGSPIDSGV